MLRREQRQDQPEYVLHRDADEHVDEGHDHRPRPAARAERLHREPHKRRNADQRDDPADEAEHGRTCTDVPRDPPDERGRDTDACRESDDRWIPEHAEEVIVVDADEELCVVVQADEREIDAALHEPDARERDVERRDEREDRERQDDENGRQDERSRRVAVEARADRVEAAPRHHRTGDRPFAHTRNDEGPPVWAGPPPGTVVRTRATGRRRASPCTRRVVYRVRARRSSDSIDPRSASPWRPG